MFRVPPPPGMKPDADLDEPRVGLGGGLHRARRRSRARARRPSGHPERRRDDRHRRVLHALRRLLEPVHDLLELVPLLLVRRHDHREQVRADAEVLALVEEHDRRGSRARRVRPRRSSSVDDVCVDAVRLGRERNAENAVAEVPRPRAAFDRTGASPRGAPRAPPFAGRSPASRTSSSRGRTPRPSHPSGDRTTPLPLSSIASTLAVARAVLLHPLDRVARSRARPRSRTGRAPSCSPTSWRRRSRAMASAISPMRRAEYASERAHHLPGERAGLAAVGDELPHALPRILDLRERLRRLRDLLVAALRAVRAASSGSSVWMSSPRFL